MSTIDPNSDRDTEPSDTSNASTTGDTGAAEEHASARKRPRARRRTVAVALTAALAGGFGAAVYEYAAPDNASVVARTSPEEDDPELAAFTDADTGDCVNWDQNGEVTTNFTVVDCAQPHRFEVSTREDLSQYPTSEFGPDAPQPDRDRQSQLTSDLCAGPTMSYLDGRLDPQGRYSIAPILPPEAAWDAGDRIMLCGVAVPEGDGRYAEVSGRAAETDQSTAASVETCVRAEGDRVRNVGCDTPYSWVVTSTENLGETFTDGAWPTLEKQNEHLDAVCTRAAIDFMNGGEAPADGEEDAALYQSTLTPFWTTLPQESWNAGSRTVNCALTKARDDDSFADLRGDVRGEFTIDGEAPEAPPDRRPLRDRDNGQDD